MSNQGMTSQELLETWGIDDNGPDFSWQEAAQRLVEAKDTAALLALGKDYAKYREKNTEPFQGSDDALADIIQGYLAHKGNVQ